MIITGRRIRTLQRHLGFLPQNAPIIIGKSLVGINAATLTRVGFPVPAIVNSAVVPAAGFGPISLYNAEGREVPNRNLPMEDASRLVWRRWEDWHGNEHTGYVTVNYRRYPRTFHPPPGIELRISATTQDEQIITTTPSIYNAANTPGILHKVNLLLEVFGECEVFTDNLERIIQAPVVRLNWSVLPRGQYPWAQVNAQLQPIIHNARQVEQPVIQNRLERLNGHDPEFVAIGQGGFAGYVIFGFPPRNLYLLESIYFGNATYGFGQNWQALSQLTKAEILNNNLHTHRIVHRDGWHAAIDHLFV